ncbi:MAG: tetratricopeptide repeat protein [Planctomycetes bacterium]|nr:tetratricopeptide repeat protein [Planctomycetota bacterium]
MNRGDRSQKTGDRRNAGATLASAVAIVLCLACGYAAEPLPGTANEAAGRPEEERRLWRFALERLAAGDGPRAVTEAMRLRSYYPDSPLADDARLLEGTAYARARRYDQAIEAYRTLARETPESPLAPHARYQEALALYDSRRYEEASDALARVGAPWENESAYLGVLSRLHERRWDEAADKMEAQTRNPVRPAQAPSPAEIRAGTDLGRKSPRLAGTMSAILPGTGQMYAGRTSDGFHALFWNGLFAAATIESLDEDLDAPAVLFGGLFVAFYVSNIRNAAIAAHWANDSAGADYASVLADRALPERAVWDAEPDPANLSITLRWRY